MKLQLALCAILLAAASGTASAHPHQAPPAPPAPPSPPSMEAPEPPPIPGHGNHLAPPAPPAIPPMPAMPPMPPVPPIPDIDVPDEVLLACEGKSDGARIAKTVASGAHITGTCVKRGNVYMFKLNSYEQHTTTTKHRR